jgi:hypothetical protein
MYCINCGLEVNSIAKFCNQCGTRQILEKNDPIKLTPSVQVAKGAANQSKSSPDNGVGFKFGYWFGVQNTKNRAIFIISIFIGLLLLTQFGSNLTSTPSNVTGENKVNSKVASDDSKEKDSFIAYCSAYPLTGGYTLGGDLAEKLGKSKVRQWCSCAYPKTKEKMSGNETIQVLSGELGSVDPATKKFGYESMNAIASCVEQDESTKDSNIAKSLVGLLRSQANLFKL